MMTTIDRRNELTEALRPRVDRLIESEFASLLKNQSIQPADVLGAFRQYRHYCSRFPKFLSLLLARSESEVARRPLIANLWEESGEGNLQNSHLQLLDRFLNATAGGSPDVSPGAAVSKYVFEIERYLWNQPVAAAFGFIGPGTEEITSRQYSIFLEALRGYQLWSESDLIFFASHIEADVRHANLFWDALANICKSEEDWRQVKVGAEASLDLELTFWKELVADL